jgi:PAS domain S-box-containing protein
MNGTHFLGATDWSEEALRTTLTSAQQDSTQKEISGPSGLLLPLRVEGETLGALVASGDISPTMRTVLRTMQSVITLSLEQALEKRGIARETLERYREINLLYDIGETIGATLDVEKIPTLVLQESSRIIRADAGAVLLVNHTTYRLEIRASYGADFSQAPLSEIAERLAQEVLTASQSQILGGLRIRTKPGDESAPISAILCTPLRTQDRQHGAILLLRCGDKPVFAASDEKLLIALASQAAIAIENAYLFANTKQQMNEIAAMKNYMDNIFASIASGVITTDIQDTIITLNRAAEHILAVSEEMARGQPYVKVLSDLGRVIAPLVNAARRHDAQTTGYEVEPELPQRGQVVLRLHISPLKDSMQTTNGVAIVIDDLTERRQLEQQVRQVRETFERYVAPRVVEQLLSDPSNVQLGGVRMEVTALFADIRGFTSYSEKVDPEILVEVLNRHLTLAADAILAEEGTLDKFMGDAVMAIFNAPLPQPDHVLRAVRTALTMQRTIAEMHAHLPADERLSFGIGITTDQAVIGNVGSATIHNYTAIGDSVNTAQRLQTHAKPGQILLNTTAYERVREHVIGRELGLVQLKGHSEPDRVFEVLGLTDEHKKSLD